MKKAFKVPVISILAWQVRRLRKRNNLKVIAVVGSIGKTSTKFAIAKVVGQSLRVRYQEGNYNDIVSVPLIFFDEKLPSLINPIAWLKIFLRNEKKIKRDYPYDVVVVELGTDGPGQIAAFHKYLHADIAVVTAIAPEHMEYFSSLEAVAAEELSVSRFSDVVVYNADLCSGEYVDTLSQKISYGIESQADYKIKTFTRTQDGFDASIESVNGTTAFHYQAIAETQLYSALAAFIIAEKLGLTSQAIVVGLAAIEPVSGRMRTLRGIKNSTIIDDTYNASPEAVKAALETLSHITAPQKVALLGNMNELGAFSEQSHREVGSYCDPRQLAFVVTIGKDANHYLAEEAEKRGCKVQRCTSPYEAGSYIAQNLLEGAVVLAKGSQNGVFAEEALKSLLADPGEQQKLVRQSEDWMKTKARQFPKTN